MQEKNVAVYIYANAKDNDQRSDRFSVKNRAFCEKFDFSRSAINIIMYYGTTMWI